MDTNATTNKSIFLISFFLILAIAVLVLLASNLASPPQLANQTLNISNKTTVKPVLPTVVKPIQPAPPAPSKTPVLNKSTIIKPVQPKVPIPNKTSVKTPPMNQSIKKILNSSNISNRTKVF
jgi:hypothetical protein